MADAHDMDETLKRLERLVEQMERDRATRTTRLRVNKRTHRIRFEGETEDSVEVVIEPKGEQP
ncbi:MAG TPA: hypothetical protein VF546_14030 [Pyrinomonadaceae bacterium]|jgi:hypothetical protein